MNGIKQFRRLTNFVAEPLALGHKNPNTNNLPDNSFTGISVFDLVSSKGRSREKTRPSGWEFGIRWSTE